MRPAHIRELMVFEREMFGPEAWTERGYRAELADHRSRHYIVALASGSDRAVADPDVGDNTGDASPPRASTDVGRLAGWAGVMLVGEDAEVLTVGTIPSRRRQGIASRLLDDLESTARENGALQIFLEVRVDNEAAIALYAGRGYEQVGVRRGYYEGGRVDAVVMRRALGE